MQEHMMVVATSISANDECPVFSRYPYGQATISFDCIYFYKIDFLLFSFFISLDYLPFGEVQTKSFKMQMCPTNSVVKIIQERHDSTCWTIAGLFCEASAFNYGCVNFFHGVCWSAAPLVI